MAGCSSLIVGCSSVIVTKMILVEHEEDSVPVSFTSDFKAAREAAAVQLSVPPTDLVLKIQSKEWGGRCRWINVCETDVIPDKAILRVVLRKSAKVWFNSHFCLLTIHSFFIQKSQTANTTTIDANVSTSLKVLTSSSSSSYASGGNPVQMRLCSSQDQLGLRKPHDHVR